MKIVADSHIPFIKDYFGQYGDLILKPGRDIHANDVRDADILMVRSITHVDAKLLENSHVKFVGSVTAGTDHLDTKWLDQAGIAWSAATGFNAPPVADYVVSAVAALQRKGILPTTGVRAAVIGVGNVGQLVENKLRLLNFELALCDPLRAEKEADFASVPLEEIANFDFISLHVPLTRTGAYPTHHFIDKHFLQRQKKGAVLLNVSRGAVIDSLALLQYGTHLNWCLDVWENEPRIHKTILERATIATPHIAGYSVQSKIRGIDMIYRIACDKKILPTMKLSPLHMPKQVLRFAGDNHHWQDIVLGVFNPLVITAMMRTILLPATEYGSYFDEMRNQFNYRYEFSFTKLQNVQIAENEKKLLAELGLRA